MKKALFFAGLAAATLSFVGCNKEADYAGRNGDFEVILQNDDTRTVNNGMQTVWAKNDQLSAFYAPAGTTTWSSNIKFTVKEAGSNLATGEVGELTGSAYDWYFLYPYSGYVASPTGLNAEGEPSGYMTVGSAANGSQRQAGYNSMAHLAGSALPVYGVVKNVPTGEQPVVAMHQLASVVKVNVKNATAAPVHIMNVAVTAPVDIVGTYYLDITGAAPGFTPSGENYVSKTASLVVADHTDLAVGATASFYLAVKPFTAAAGSDFSVSVTGSNGEQTSVKPLVAETVFSAGKIKEVNVNYDKAATVSEYEWVKKNLESITEEDVFVIVGNNGADFAMSNDNGTTAAPAAVSVSVQDDKLMLEPAANIQWTLTKSGSNYTFMPKDGETHLYCTNANNGVRVGTNENSEFTLDQGYLKHVATSRYVGIYNSTDWRCYTSINNNISGQTFAFYVKYATGSGTPDKTFRAELEGALDGSNLEVPASTVSANIVILADADIAWTIVPSEGLTPSAFSGTGPATVTVSFAANTSTTEKFYSILVGTDAEGVSNDEYELCITQLGVPAPEAKTIPFIWDFSQSQGDFTIENVTLPEGLDYVWSYDSRYHYMKASAYKSETNYATESWLVSPLVDMTGATTPVLSFSHVINKFFGTVENEATVWIKEEGGNWNQLTITYPDFPEGKNFSNWGDVSLDVASYAGKKVQVGFKYVSTSDHAGTWEVKNFKLANASTGPEDPTFTVPSTLTVEEGKTAKINVTTNTDGAITYTSASTAVATVAADGTVTGVAAGTTTITVAAAATSAYNAASATVAVTVTEAQTGSHYGKVNTITSGKKYLIVSGGKFGDKYYAMEPPTGTAAGRPAGAVVTISDGKIVSDATTDSYAVTLNKSGEDVSIVLPNGNYLVYSGSGTGVMGSETATDFWNVAPGMYGSFRLVVKSLDTRSLAFRGGDSSNCFGAYMSNNVNGTEYFDVDLYELGAEPASGPVDPSFSVSSSINVEVGQTAEISVTTNSDGAVSYSSSAPSIATVDAAGKVTGVAAGTATITVSVAATANFNAASKQVPVTVTAGDAGLTFNLAEKSETTGTDSWPTGAHETAVNAVYSLDGTNYTFNLGPETYMGVFSGAVYLMVKKGSYLGLPAIAGKKLVNVKVKTSANASTSTKGTVCKNADGTSPVSSTVTLNQKNSYFSWSLTGTEANTMYYIVVSSANSQFVELVLTYE